AAAHPHARVGGGRGGRAARPGAAAAGESLADHLPVAAEGRGGAAVSGQDTAMSMGRRRWAAMVAVLVALAGCSGLRSNAEPDRLYVLRAAPDAGGTPLPGVLIVPRPAVQPGLDTARIALTRPGNQLDYYAGSRWTSTLPRVLTAFAVQSMDGAFATVAAADRGAGPADYELLLTVRHFEAEYADGSGAPKVRVALDGLL